MKLKAYLDARGESVAMFCARTRIRSRNTVYRYLRGERRPNADMMERIKHATGGLVTADDFFHD